MGAGDGPETFNDLSRGTPPGVEDFPAEDVATAEEVCSEYVGLDETTYTECLLDVLYTDDASFTVGYRAALAVVGSGAAADDLMAVSTGSAWRSFSTSTGSSRPRIRSWMLLLLRLLSEHSAPM